MLDAGGVCHPSGIDFQGTVASIKSLLFEHLLVSKLAASFARTPPCLNEKPLVRFVELHNYFSEELSDTHAQPCIRIDKLRWRCAK
jgi:hypothetical protein